MMFFKGRRKNYDINATSTSRSGISKMKLIFSMERRAFLFIISLFILVTVALVIIIVTHVIQMRIIELKYVKNYLQPFNQTQLGSNENFSNRSIFQIGLSLSTISNVSKELKTGEVGRENRCGKQSNFSGRVFKRIVNSKIARETYGWVVSIRLILKNNRLSNHFCAGSLIDTNFILTSANCIYQYKPSQGNYKNILSKSHTDIIILISFF